MTDPTYQPAWVKAHIWQKSAGFSRRTINRIIARGEWQRGIHYNYKGRFLMINIKNVDKWAGSIDKSNAA